MKPVTVALGSTTLEALELTVNEMGTCPTAFTTSSPKTALVGIRLFITMAFSAPRQTIAREKWASLDTTGRIFLTMTRRFFLKVLGLVWPAVLVPLRAFGLASKNESEKGPVSSSPLPDQRAIFILRTKEIEERIAELVPPYFISNNPERDRKAICLKIKELLDGYQWRGLLRSIATSEPNYCVSEALVKGGFTIQSNDEKTLATVSWQYAPNALGNGTRFKRVMKVYDTESIKRAFDSLPEGRDRVEGEIGLIEQFIQIE
jgi:hypothetical protein